MSAHDVLRRFRQFRRAESDVGTARAAENHGVPTVPTGSNEKEQRRSSDRGTPVKADIYNKPRLGCEQPPSEASEASPSTVSFPNSVGTSRNCRNREENRSSRSSDKAPFDVGTGEAPSDQLWSDDALHEPAANDQPPPFGDAEVAATHRNLAIVIADLLAAGQSRGKVRRLFALSWGELDQIANYSSPSISSRVWRSRARSERRRAMASEP